MTTRSFLGRTTRAGVVSVAMILIIATGGRLLGFFREVLISSQYGTSAPADAFFTVQQIPTIVSTFLFGPFMIAYVPYHAVLRASGIEREAIRGSIRAAVRIGVAITAGMAALGLASVLIEGRGAGSGRGLIGPFAIVLAISIVPLLVTGLASVVLNARGQHVGAMVIAALTPAGMLGCLVLLTLVPLVGHEGALPWSFVAGSVISAAAGLVALRRVTGGQSSAPEATPPLDAPRRAFRKELLASAAENVGFSLNQALTVWLSAGLGGGLVAVFSYGFRISTFAFSLVSPVGIWMQTWMTRDRSHREGRLLFLLLAGTAFTAVAIAAALVVAGGPLVAFVYLRGSFSGANAASVTSVLAPLAVYGAVVTLNQFMARYYFVLLRGALYSRVMIAAYVVGNLLKVALVGPLGLHGVIWASVLAEGGALAYFLVEILRRGGSAAETAPATRLPQPASR